MNLFEQDQSFKDTVVRQAILLGFEGRQAASSTNYPTVVWWAFAYKGVTYEPYGSLYSAALEYLRLSKFPNELIGVIRAEVPDA